MRIESLMHPMKPTPLIALSGTFLIESLRGSLVLESPMDVVIQLFLIGAATGSLALAVLAGYSILAPRIRRFVSSRRMDRIRQPSGGSKENGENP